MNIFIAKILSNNLKNKKDKNNHSPEQVIKNLADTCQP